MKQQRSGKDKNYYAAQMGKTTANKARRATIRAKRKLRWSGANLPKRKTSLARQKRRALEFNK